MPHAQPFRPLLAALFLCVAAATGPAAQASGIVEFLDPRLNLVEGQGSDITVVRSGDTSGEATVTLNVSLGGTARLGEDFTIDLPLGVVRIPAGQFYGRATLDTVQNTAVDGTRYAVLTLANPGGAVLGRETALLLQVQDDEDAAIDLSLPGTAVRRVIEGNELPIDILRAGATQDAVTATLVGVPGTAGLGIDFSDLTSTVEFAPDQAEQQALLATIAIATPGRPRTLTVMLASPEPEDRAAFSGLGPLVVIEEPTGARAGEFSIFTDTPTVVETDESVIFTVDRNRGSTGAATVNWVTVDGSGDNPAVAGRDYVAAGGSLAFADGETRKTFAVALVAGDEDRRRRSFQVALAAPSALAGIDPEGRAATVTIDRDGGGGNECQGFCNCFIATAAWGSWMHPHVATLRGFRDDVLMPTAPGRALVAFYYRHSPPLAAFIARHEPVRGLARALLTPVVVAVSHPLATALALLLALLGAMNLRRRMQRKHPA